MKNFTKILAVVIALTFVVTSAAVGISAGTETSWYSAAVNYLDSIKVAAIGETGDEACTRNDFVTWVAKIESHQLADSAWKNHNYETAATSVFTDLTDDDNKGAIGYAVNREFIQGYGDGTFGPDDTITLAQACAVIVRMMGYQDLVDGSDWAYNNMFVANSKCGAIDTTFVANIPSYDPDTTLTKGAAAWLLYTVMNGAYHVAGYTDNEYKVLRNEGKIKLTNLGVDLGAWFYNSDTINTTVNLVVANLPLHYKSDYYYSGTNATMIATPVYSNSTGNYSTYNRIEVVTTGARYASVMNYKLLRSDGRIDESDPDAIVTMKDILSGDVYTLTVSEFCSLIRASEGITDTTTNLSLFVELGSVVTAKAVSKEYRKYQDGTATFADVVSSLTVTDSIVADTYLGTATDTTANDAKGLSEAGWSQYSSTSLKGTKRVSDNVVAWDGDSLLVNGVAYDVVTAFTGVSKELKVYTVEGLGTTTKAAGVVKNAGDKLYAGATLDATNYAVLVAGDTTFTAADFTVSGDTYTVKATKALSVRLGTPVAYEMTVAGYTTNATLNLASVFVGEDGRIDDNVVGLKALSVAEAKQIILAPAQGECNVVFSDVNGDGSYEYAVVTESSRATYYGTVNAVEGLNDLEGSLADGGKNNTNEVYDSFGNFLTSTITYKGQNVGGLVVDKLVTMVTDSMSTSDAWQITDANVLSATNKVQLVVCPTGERTSQITLQNQYGQRATGAYTIVDVATLTTGYIESVYLDKEDGYYVANVVVGKSTKTLYIPTVINDAITLDITLDGVTAPVTFMAGKSLMSFVTDYVAANQIGADVAAQSGAWMAGHTVKFVANEDGVVWCMVETATTGMTDVYTPDCGAFTSATNAVRGFVTGIEKNEKGDNLYNVTLVSSGDRTANSTATTTTTVDSAWVTESLNLDVPTLFEVYGKAAMLDPTKTITVYVVEQDLIDYLNSLGNDYLYKDQTLISATILPTEEGYADGKGTVYNKLKDEIGEYYLNKVVIEASAPNATTNAITYTYKLTFANFDRVMRSRNSDIAYYMVSGIALTDEAGNVFAGSSDGKVTLHNVSGNFTNNNIARCIPAGTVMSDYDYLMNTWHEELEKIAAETGKTFFSKATITYAQLTGYTTGINWDVFNTKASNNVIDTISLLETGKKLTTVTVKASATAVWDYTASTYAIVNNLLVHGVDYTVNTAAAKVDSSDLLYLSFSKDAGKYYTIEGVDASAHALQDTGYTYYYTCVLRNNQASTGKYAFINLDTNCVPSAWRTGLYLFYTVKDNYGLAANTWTAGGETNVILGEFSNDYVLEKTVADSTKVPLVDSLGRTYGYYITYNVKVGSDPYYYRTSYNVNGATYELRFKTVTTYTGVKGEFYYTVDYAKTILIELYKNGGADRSVFSDYPTEYSNDAKYYVNSDNEVYLLQDIDGDNIGDLYYTSNTTSTTATFADLTAGTPVVANDVTVDKKLEKSLSTLTAVAQAETETGYVPGTYYVSINNGINEKDVKTVKMDETATIVVMNPSNDAGKPVFSYITVADLAALNAAGHTLFVTDYQYDGTASVGTMLSVIGCIYSETPVTPVTPTFVVGDGETLVKVAAGTKVLVKTEETGKYWVIETVTDAVDAVTEESVGTIMFRYSTYETDERTVYANATAIENGGYYVINSANVVVNDTVTAEQAASYIANH